jgi:hypothetical protein
MAENTLKETSLFCKRKARDFPRLYLKGTNKFLNYGSCKNGQLPTPILYQKNDKGVNL